MPSNWFHDDSRRVCYTAVLTFALFDDFTISLIFNFKRCENIKAKGIYAHEKILTEHMTSTDIFSTPWWRYDSINI